MSKNLFPPLLKTHAKQLISGVRCGFSCHRCLFWRSLNCPSVGGEQDNPLLLSAPLSASVAGEQRVVSLHSAWGGQRERRTSNCSWQMCEVLDYELRWPQSRRLIGASQGRKCDQRREFVSSLAEKTSCVLYCVERESAEVFLSRILLRFGLIVHQDFLGGI